MLDLTTDVWEDKPVQVQSLSGRERHNGGGARGERSGNWNGDDDDDGDNNEDVQIVHSRLGVSQTELFEARVFQQQLEDFETAYRLQLEEASR